MYSDFAIKVEGLYKYYPTFDSPIERLKQVIKESLSSQEIEYNSNDFCALNNLELEVLKGEVVAILGKNGSGKSTLLQAICGTLSPSKGSVSVNGRVAALLELGAGFNPDFTGRENIYLNASILGLTNDEIEEKLDGIIDFSEIKEHIDHPVKHYSSGMYVRLAFSIAISVNPDILIIDEALSVGDAKFQAKCIKKIQSIMESGATILFVSHDITSVRTLCNRAVWLDSGRKIMDGEVFEVTANFMQSMYDGAIDAENQQKVACNQETKYISHWGESKGSVKKVSILTSSGEEKSVFGLNDEMNISVIFYLPKGVEAEHINVAISVKNLKAVDLIVVSESIPKQYIAKSEFIRCNFKLLNQLLPGDYFLVVALEDNRAMDGFYYEYIEGAKYFSSTSTKKVHGQFCPDVSVNFS